VPLEAGIVGLPSAGKTTLFNALTGAGARPHEAKAHVGMASIADERLAQVAAVEGSAKSTPAQMRVEDVPGTGPALLGNLRQADALLAVVDAFSPGADPARDLEQLLLELLVADSEHVAKRLERVRTEAKSGDPKLRAQVEELEALLAHVEAGGAIGDYGGSVPESLEPLTTKPLVTVENGPGGIDCLLEMELAELPEEEATELREGPSALEEVVRGLRDALDLITFFTANESEARAWTLRRGSSALDAAGHVHSDMARGFIRCEVIRWSELVECGSRAEAARRGLQRLEGRDYVVEDGDVLQIRFAL
jgi:ribosome-binding ATPase YchF (GTP1/OBG family)